MTNEEQQIKLMTERDSLGPKFTELGVSLLSSMCDWATSK
jgi:hypothetical protein